MRTVGFFIAVNLMMFWGRKTGWALTPVLSAAPSVFTYFGCLLWGAIVAYGLRVLVNIGQPWLPVEIYGFGAAAYASIPNYGLHAASLPVLAWAKQKAIGNVSLAGFCLTCAVLWFFFTWKT